MKETWDGAFEYVMPEACVCNHSEIEVIRSQDLEFSCSHMCLKEG